MATIQGTSGNDSFFFNPSSAVRDTIDGGAGFDAVRLGALPDGINEQILINLATGQYKWKGFFGSSREGPSGLVSIEALYGGKGWNSTFIGDDNANWLDGSSVVGGGGNDTLRGGQASYDDVSSPVQVTFDAAGQRALVSFDGQIDDVATGGISLGGGNDHMQGSGRNLSGGWIVPRVYGNAGDDVLIGATVVGGLGNDTLSGELASYEGAAGPVNVSLASGRSEGAAGVDTLLDIHSLRGSAHADVLSGDEANNRLYGGGGNDRLQGGGGDDTLVPGPGVVFIDGGPGIDTLALSYLEVPADGFNALSVNVDLRGGQMAGTFVGVVVGVEVIDVRNLFGTINLRGLDGPAEQRGEWFRGDVSNATVEGGSGIDTFVFSLGSGRLQVQRSPGSATGLSVSDWFGSGGPATQLNGIERVQATDAVFAFGERAIEVAKVAFALWSPQIAPSMNLFGRGVSWYDDGHSYRELIDHALTFHSGLNDEAFARHLVANVPGTRTAAELQTLIAANGGGTAGRAHVTQLLADSAQNMANIELAGLKINGIGCALTFAGNDLFAIPGS